MSETLNVRALIKEMLDFDGEDFTGRQDALEKLGVKND